MQVYRLKIYTVHTVCVSSPGTGIPHGILARDRETEISGNPREMYWRNIASKISGWTTTTKCKQKVFFFVICIKKCYIVQCDNHDWNAIKMSGCVTHCLNWKLTISLALALDL